MQTKSLTLLNAVQKLLVDFANDQQISLAAEFGTVDNFKRFVIAFTFKQLTELGIETREAYDLVFGDGSYDRLAEDVWTRANAC
jgi:hypothetical protein